MTGWRKGVVVAAAVLTTAACTSQDDSAGSSKIVPVQVVYRNNNCAAADAGVEIILNHTGLETWWQPLGEQQVPKSPLPSALKSIEFERSAVFVVRMGQQPTAGYGIDLSSDDAAVLGKSLTIPVAWREPAPDAIAPQVVTNPCMVVIAPANQYDSVVIQDEKGESLATTHF